MDTEMPIAQDSTTSRSVIFGTDSVFVYAYSCRGPAKYSSPSSVGYQECVSLGKYYERIATGKIQDHTVTYKRDIPAPFRRFGPIRIGESGDVIVFGVDQSDAKNTQDEYINCFPYVN